ncbi:transporter substrate-binding domain-containing protein [Georgenia halophila]|uniref:Transporter substrate-binding domain-containing protein n=1 Tax=Georgenia halophila TaxID=620889 RepID=A0ABP8LK72_9MICO
MRRLVIALVVLLAVGACGVTIPTDPDGTLDRVRGGTLRVGVSPNSPWTDLPKGTDADPVGIEVELVQEFAETLDAEIVWVPGGEEELITELEHGYLDMVIGGLTARSPWSSKVALTYRYTVTTNVYGQEEQHVMAVPMGENAFQAELERLLFDQDLPV